MPRRPRVLITGSSGALGSTLMTSLPGLGFDVRGLDVVPPAEAAGDAVTASVDDLDAVLRASAGADAVVHLGGASTPEATWDECLRSNIDGTRVVLEAARRAGVPRVVLASSNHVAGFTPSTRDEVPADVPMRPDSLYGVSKAAVEALGSFYADEHGLQVASLRIGSCFPRPTSTRMLATWLSPADFVRLAVAALTADWSGHITVWGVSRNTRRRWSLTEGARIGFVPEDDAEVFADGLPPGEERYLGGLAPAAAGQSRTPAHDAGPG